jgi:hypothetical protein
VDNEPGIGGKIDRNTQGPFCVDIVKWYSQVQAARDSYAKKNWVPERRWEFDWRKLDCTQGKIVSTLVLRHGWNVALTLHQESEQWKPRSVRFRELFKRGVAKDLAARTAGSAYVVIGEASTREAERTPSITGVLKGPPLR